MRSHRFALALPLALLTACSSSPGKGADAPSATLTDPKSTTAERRGAVDALAAQLHAEPDPTVKLQLRESLKKIAWKRSEIAQVRVQAVNALADDAANAPDTIAMLNLMLPTENAWPVLERVCTLATERGWKDLTPGLVRSWSRPVPEPADDARPERAALVALHPDRAPSDVVFDIFATPATGQFAERTRSDAWTLLCRIDPAGESIRQRLTSGPLPPGADSDPFIADLRAAVALHALPTTSEQLDWLRDLRTPAHAAFWSAAAAVVSTLSPDQLRGFELRHAAIVLWASRSRPQLLRASEDELVSLASTALSGRKRHQRTADTPVASAAAKETIEAWREKLVWADLLSIVCALDAVQDAAVARALFEQAEADRADISTEHGGVLDVTPEGAFAALPYPPRASQRVSDTRFIASSDLLKAGAESIFHYHFHAQKHENDEYAGPGQGDLEYAKTFGRACIVFTFVSSEALGADYYQPNGARVDLGAIRKP